MPQEAANPFHLLNHREVVCYFYLTQITWITQIFGALARLGAGAVFLIAAQEII